MTYLKVRIARGGGTGHEWISVSAGPVAVELLVDRDESNVRAVAQWARWAAAANWIHEELSPWDETFWVLLGEAVERAKEKGLADSDDDPIMIARWLVLSAWIAKIVQMPVDICNMVADQLEKWIENPSSAPRPPIHGFTDAKVGIPELLAWTMERMADNVERRRRGEET